jgi:hypothetical protein
LLAPNPVRKVIPVRPHLHVQLPDSNWGRDVVDPPTPDNAARQAINALAGYAYQLYQTLLAWVDLQPEQLLFVEVAEDYAVATATTLDAAQIRDSSQHYTSNRLRLGSTQCLLGTPPKEP